MSDQSTGGAGETVHMPTYIKQRTDLALTYAKDGAYLAASIVLHELALFVANHAASVMTYGGNLSGGGVET